MSPSNNPPRREIYLSKGDLLSAVEQIERLLIEHDPQVFQRGGAIYLKSVTGRPVRATAQMLRLRTMAFANFYVIGPESRFDELTAIDPPLKYFSALLHKGEWEFPLLDDTTEPSAIR